MSSNADIGHYRQTLSKDEFYWMTDDIIRFLQRHGYNAIAKDKANTKLTAFRRNIHIPGLLYDMGLSAFKTERFLIKIESQDQGVSYNNKLADIQGCGFFFGFPVPSDPILCAMKTAALINRSKGRDFYDAMYLLSQTEPDYTFLYEKANIPNKAALQEKLVKVAEKTDLQHKTRDFEHLLFNKEHSKKILSFRKFIEDL